MASEARAAIRTDLIFIEPAALNLQPLSKGFGFRARGPETLTPRRDYWGRGCFHSHLAGLRVGFQCLEVFTSEYQGLTSSDS